MTLKEYRTKNQLTQAWMARHLEITQARYCRIENGVSVPGRQLVNRIKAVTNCSVDYIDIRPDIYEDVMGDNISAVAEAASRTECAGS